jgi:hypothetical protein
MPLGGGGGRPPERSGGKVKVAGMLRAHPTSRRATRIFLKNAFFFYIYYKKTKRQDLCKESYVYGHSCVLS